MDILKKLKSKLILMITMPILGVLWFAIQGVWQASSVHNEASDVLRLARLSVKASVLLHELQKERGLSAGYIGSQGKKFTNELPDQKHVTDSRITDLRNYIATNQQNLDQDYRQMLNQKMADLDQLSSVRIAVAQQDISIKEQVNYYTGINSNLIAIIADLPKISSLGELNNAANAYVSFILSKERAGLERAILAVAFSENTFKPGRYDQFSRLVTEQTTYINAFKLLANANQLKSFDTMTSQPEFIVTSDMRQKAIDNANTGKFGIDPSEWFKQQTGKINHMKAFEDQLSADLVELARDSESTAWAKLVSTIAMASVSILVGILLAFILGRKILLQLGCEPEELRIVAKAIANDHLDIEMDCRGARGVYAAMCEMRQNLSDRIITERKSAERNARVTQALDNASGNVMVADMDGKITYMNKALGKFMEEIESDMKQIIPDFDSTNLLGANIDQFHRNPKHQRDIIDNLKHTTTAEVPVGKRFLRITVNPVYGANGERMGTVAEWFDRTQEIVTENEVQAIVDSARVGDLSHRIDLSGKEGFFNRLSIGINQMVDVSECAVNDTVGAISAMARGDLTHRIQNNYEGSFGQLKDDVNLTITKLTQVMTEISYGANRVLDGSLEIAEGNSNLSERTEQQAANLEETASSMEEITSTVQQNANNAQQANVLATNTRQQAEGGGEVVKQAVSAMNEITESSTKIADIIGVIDEIAFQTNLLALNAAVEAARAGDHGRGFAVVASEVRNLAGRSAIAAKEIKELIEDSVAKVGEGSKLVDRSGKTLQEIVTSVKQLSDLIADIANASREQNEGIEQVNQAVSQIDESTQKNAALVEEAAAASVLMGEQAKNLNEHVSFFRTESNTTASKSTKYEGKERRNTDRPWNQKVPSEMKTKESKSDSECQWKQF